jgi:XRE family transcriptional regulator, fatty acid utilization regulator
MDSLSQLIAKRIRAAREGASASQDAVAGVLGLKDRQSVSAIELGERKVSSEELVKVARFFNKPIDFFTDPYLVTEHNAFSYRATAFDKAALEDFKAKAERLISALRRFRSHLKEVSGVTQTQLRDLDAKSSWRHAVEQGEQTALAWGLGPIPAQRLRDVAEQKLEVSILFVDADAVMSGAACHLEDGDVILVNRNECEGRRNGDIGHEIFHIMTWRDLPPEPFELAKHCFAEKRTRVETLADSFAAGLLMPSTTVRERWADGTNDLSGWLSKHASEMLVTAEDLYARLVSLDLVSSEERPMPQLELKAASPTSRERPPLYNRAFVQRLHTVLNEGYLTSLRAADVLDCSLDELVQVFRSYQMEPPFAY